MTIPEPEQLKVVSFSSYEHILYAASDGRYFLTLTHESGLMPYGETVLLTPEEKNMVESNAESSIEILRDTFCHGSKTFTFHGGERAVPDFSSWEAAKTAIAQWHNEREE